MKLHYAKIIALCKIVEAKDGLTGRHVERVGEFSYKIAKTLGINPEMCEEIKYAAKVHDIGKVIIPNAILQKTDKLLTKEFETVKTHTTKGLEMFNILSKNSSSITIKDIIMHHHERYNGNGYPHKLKKEEIPLSARIVAVTDVFDALIHKRAYKEAWSREQAIDYVVQQREEYFDPEVVDAFLHIVDLYIGII